MTGVTIDKYTIVSWDLLSGFRKDGALQLELDELTDFTLSNSEEKTPVNGKNGRVLMNIKRNKAVTASGTNAMLSGGLLAAQLGSDVETGAFNINHRDVLTVGEDNTVMLTHKTPTGATAGTEIGKVYVKNSENGNNIVNYTTLTQVAEAPAATGQFQYTAATKTITFFTGDVAEGDEVIVYYETPVEGYEIVNDSESYSEVLLCTLDVTCQDICDNIFHGQFRFYRADFNGTFDITGGTDPTAHSFEFETLPNICNGETLLWNFVVFDQYEDAA